MVKRYKTKPCEIQAIRWNGNNEKEMFYFIRDNYYINHDLDFIIKTLEGDMRADIGDYIIKGLRGEFYPCKPDVFEKKYELISQTNHERLAEITGEDEPVEIESLKMLLCKIYEDVENGDFEYNYDKYLLLYESQMKWLNEKIN